MSKPACGECEWFEECTKRDWRNGVGSHEEQHDPECPARSSERKLKKTIKNFNKAVDGMLEIKWLPENSRAAKDALLAARGHTSIEPEETPIEEIGIPTNLEACFKAIKEIFSEEEIKRFKGDSEEDAIVQHHFGLGQWMRNNWGLWSGSVLKDWFIEKGLEHADDMSGVILVSLWRHLNDKPIGLDEQIEIYKDYWKSIEERK